MKINQKQKAENREKILSTAAKKFRELGFDGIGVSELTKLAGFTHGGLYSHFASKEDLMAKVCGYSTDKNIEWWKNNKKLSPNFNLGAMAKFYLNAAHRDDPGTGCMLACLAADVTRQSPKVKKAFTEALRRFVAFATDATPGKLNSTKRKNILSTWSMMVGALILARAVSDPEFSDEILKSSSESIGIIQKPKKTTKK